MSVEPSERQKMLSRCGELTRTIESAKKERLSLWQFLVECGVSTRDIGFCSDVTDGAVRNAVRRSA